MQSLVRDEPMLSLMTASVQGDEEDSRSGPECACSAAYGEEAPPLDGAGTATADDES